MDDDESEDAFFAYFDEMFGGGKSGGFGMFDDFDAFTDILAADQNFMKNMFR